MPKEVKTSSHRSSISTASAAGGSRSSASWSAKDDETLIAARASGLNWNQIAPRYFPSKTPNACRKRHERLMERKNAEEWDGVKLETLAEAYMEVRQEMWTILAARVGEKWTLVEQKCMEKGMKNLQQAYRSAQKKQGTYDGHDDSGIGCSDPEDEVDRAGMADAPGAHDVYPDRYAQGQQSQRLPSIPSMLAVPGPAYSTASFQ
ncbi:hypothetical protein K469DRAFT_717377 [Zopfia rhizophila CBS 207.26]|uniref:Myb-like domain-containing protein n=1 Tax=Zopfia rhizophila CBS 207.26 TaxID=1314779 RepID=A0A6A6EP36_9PEZI|nr:hypothetical protein K469DRAFT_717377 [Zopfia rhizophila CBS 207.26]